MTAMKKNQLLAMILILSAVGCTEEDMSECSKKVKENTIVHFSLKDQANNQIFTTIVGNVMLFVYDTDGNLVTQKAVSKSELNIFSGTRLQLEPGAYKMSAWANYSSQYTNFHIDGGKPCFDLDHNYLINAVPENGVIADGDPLYHAPKTKGDMFPVTVPAEGEVEVIAEFRNAHIKMEITVEGYGVVPTRIAGDPLTIEITNITSRYCLGMIPFGEKVSYIGQAPNVDFDTKIFRILFHVPLFDRSTDTEILISNSAGRLIIVPIVLRELLGDKIELDEILHLPIKIVFTEENGLLQGTVVVDLPEWGEGDVEPYI